MNPWEVNPIIYDRLTEAYDPDRGFISYPEFDQRLNEIKFLVQNPRIASTATIASGIASIERTERDMVAIIDTEGFAISDVLDDIQGNHWANYDTITIQPATPGRSIVIDGNGNITPLTNQPYQIGNGEATISTIMYLDGAWIEIFRTPMPELTAEGISVFSMAYDTAEIVAGAIGATKSTMVVVGEKTGATAAEAEGEVLVAGAAGDKLFALVDEGLGPFAIGEYEVQALDTNLDVAAGIDAAINAGALGYTCIDNLDSTFNILAPASDGATANTFQVSFVATGSVQATVNSQFAGGVDGVSGNDILETVSNTVDGQKITIVNGNPSGDIELVSGGNIEVSEKVSILPGEKVDLINIGGTLSPDQSLGPKLRFGQGIPPAALGRNGDSYIDTYRGIGYVKEAQVWAAQYSGRYQYQMNGVQTGLAGNGVYTLSGSQSSEIDNQQLWATFEATTMGVANGVMVYWTGGQLSPETLICFRLDDLTDVRFQAGLSEQVAFIDADASTGREYVGVRFSTAAGDTKFTWIMNGASGGPIVTTTSVTPVAGKAYWLHIQYYASSGKAKVTLMDNDMDVLDNAVLSGSALTGSNLLSSIVQVSHIGVGGTKIIGISSIYGENHAGW